ncbi:MAG: hypothetical protein AAF570_02015 [Bacteroidota bacterium]
MIRYLDLQETYAKFGIDPSKRLRIGLVDGDGKRSKFPNIPLMRIRNYYRTFGHEAEWFRPIDVFNNYDLVFCSKIFTFTDMPKGLPLNTIYGGTGIDMLLRLPPEIQMAPPDYDLYPYWTSHMGNTQEGCRFACNFCGVPRKEPKLLTFLPDPDSTPIERIMCNPRGGNRLMLLDNDFFGGKRWRENLAEIAEKGLKVCFSQGLNIRLITAEQAEYLSDVKYYNNGFKKRQLTFAWDRANQKKDKDLLIRGVAHLDAAGVPRHRLAFFVLIGYDSSMADDLERVRFLRDQGVRPYVMPFDRTNRYEKKFQNWVNHVPTFQSCEWEDFELREMPEFGNESIESRVQRPFTESELHWDCNIPIEEAINVRKKLKRDLVRTNNGKWMLKERKATAAPKTLDKLA